MRWTKKPAKVKTKYVDERIIEKFLLLPTCISRQYRWLETATIKQIKIKNVWINTHWLN